MNNLDKSSSNGMHPSLLSAIEHLSFIVIDLNEQNSKILDFSKGAEKVFGYTKQEIIGKKTSILHLAKDTKNLHHILIKIKKTKQPIEEEFFLLRKNRETFPAHFHFHPYYENKKVIGAIGILFDLSEQKAAEIRFNQLFNNMANGVAVYNAINDGEDFEFVNLNKAGQKLSSANIKEIRGKKVTEVFPGIKEIGLLDVFREVYKTGKPKLHPLTRYKDDRIEEWVENYVYKLPSGEIVAIYEDTSERERAIEALRINEIEKLVNEQRTQELLDKTESIEKSRKALSYLLEDVNESRAELKNVNEQLENVNRELEAFAYSVSHDLRAPLRHINGFINLLLKPENIEDKDKIIKYTDIIAKSAKKMGQLIDDLLLFSRIGRGAINLNEFSLDKLVKEIIEESKPQINDRDIEFKLSKLPKLKADRNLMNIVFSNLIGNAIKFSQNKKKAIINIEGSNDESGNILISVKDNGAGFNMKYADKLFGVFQRLHTENEFEGTGIGLANVQRIIHKHGGKIWAEGEVNKGATFYIKLN